MAGVRRCVGLEPLADTDEQYYWIDVNLDTTVCATGCACGFQCRIGADIHIPDRRIGEPILIQINIHPGLYGETPGTVQIDIGFAQCVIQTRGALGIEKGRVIDAGTDIRPDSTLSG